MFNVLSSVIPDTTLINDEVLFIVFCGLFLHALFNKCERRLNFLLCSLLILPLAPLYFIWPRYGESPIHAILFSYGLSYLTLTLSTILYRVSPLHPLAGYPGPISARCSNFWAVYHMYTGRSRFVYLKLHQQYGSVVRTGPNDLSFCDVETAQRVLGTNGMEKGPIWDGRRQTKNAIPSLLALRNKSLHLQRRKVWNRAFNIKGVRRFAPMLKRRVDQLVSLLEFNTKQKRGTDLAEMISFFAYDFMGDMAFGTSFRLMEQGDVDGLWSMMEHGIRVQAYTGLLPWLLPLLMDFSRLGKEAEKLVQFVAKTCRARLQRGPTGDIDISAYLLDEESPSPKPLPVKEYMADSFLAVAAGSDTTATSLSCIFFYLISHKTYFQMVRQEVDAHFPPHSDVSPVNDPSLLANLPLLNAVINEALRLEPPVSVGIQRAPEQGSGGEMLGSRFIPEETGITIPPYVIHRDPRYFSPNPETFWPERWLPTSDPTVITNHAAFIPFSLGPMNCAGKLLAMFQMRAVVAILVQKLDLEFEKGWDEKEWERSLQDIFLIVKGRLPVSVKLRVL